MKLLTQALLQQLPREPQAEDPMVYAKFFDPDFSWSWFVIAYDGEDTCFGFVDGDFPELGYFSLSELQSNRGAFGLPIERDRTFAPCRLSDLRNRLNR